MLDADGNVPLHSAVHAGDIKVSLNIKLNYSFANLYLYFILSFNKRLLNCALILAH